MIERIPSRIRIRIQEAQKHTDLTDPDPQHCWNHKEINIRVFLSACYKIVFSHVN
jgi:hypothetical protein